MICAYTSQGAGGVTVIVIEKRHGETCSKSRMRLFAFPAVLIPLGKIKI